MQAGSGRLGAIVLTLAVAVSLSGCGVPSSAPRALPTLHASALPLPSASRNAQSPPPDPISGKAAELAAVTAVVKRYYAVLNDLRHDMNAAGFSAIFTPECYCRAQVRGIRSARRKGEHYIDQVHVLKYTPTLDGVGAADVLVDINVSRGGLVDANGKQVTSGPAEHGTHRDFRLVKRGGRWLISELDAV